MSRLWRLSREYYLLLPLGAGIAVIWANTDGVRYFQVAHALAFAVNDVGMALALAYVAQEVIEATLPGGTLHSWRRATLPIIAGAAGTAGAIAVYIAYVHLTDEQLLRQGWPIACGVDLFVCFALARVIFRRSAAVSFIVLLAITGNVLGLAAISKHRLVDHVHPAAGVLIVAAVAVALGLRRSGVRSIWPSLSLAGPLAWWGCHWAGVHPALALLPIVPVLPHTPRHFDDLAVHGGTHRAASHFESVFEYPVHVVSFFFGLVNAGVLLHGFDTGTWAVLMASVAGRPLGILVGTLLAVTAGLTLPRQVGWRELCVMALVASAGGAFSLFLASAVFPDGPLLIETKIGAIASLAGVPMALATARLLRVGRFATEAQTVPAAFERRRHA